MLTNIPNVKLGIIAVSRDCFIISLSERRRAAVVAACAKRGLDVYECKTTVENERDMLQLAQDNFDTIIVNDDLETAVAQARKTVLDFLAK